MKLAFVGTSHAAQHLSRAAAEKGFELVRVDEGPAVVFVSEDTPTDEQGKRDLDHIRGLIDFAMVSAPRTTPIVLTSAVPPGFTRSVGLTMWHQAETLRIKDAEERARNPEMLIVGGPWPLPAPYRIYLEAFKCPILLMSWEEAEFAKIAINATLAAQVENTNRLAAAAERCGCNWKVIAEVLQHDSRIGPKSYLEPGDWRKSSHLVRDDVTLRTL